MVSFQGNGFGLSIPDGWVDRTIYTFVGSPGADATPWVRAVVDPDVVDATVEEYADRGIRAASTAAPAYRLLRRQSLRLADGAAGVRAEVRWFPTDEIRLYQRMLFAVWGKIAVTMTSHLTKKTRLTHGPIVDRVMESVRHRSSPPASGAPAAGSVRVEADRFTIELPEGFRDETVYMLAEPDESRFRRNLVIRRDRPEREPASLAEFVRAEIDDLAASVPGFELLQENPATSRDGGPTHGLSFRRSLEGGSKILQVQHVAPRGGVLYWLSLTLEDGVREHERDALLSVLASFSAGSSSPSAKGVPPGRS